MALQSFERYTCLGFDNSSTRCDLTTFNTTIMKRLDGFCKEFPKEFKMVREQLDENGVLVGKEYEFHKKYITIRKPTKRKMTEEQKKAATERLKKGREKKDAEDKAKVENKDKVEDKKETKTKTKSKTNDKDKDKDKKSK